MQTVFPNIAILIATLFTLISCSALPDKSVEKSGLEPIRYQDTRLAQGFDPLIREHGDYAGLVLLRNGDRALRERLLLADVAEHSIDAQYYIWNSDKSGRLLAYRLILAADRGVTVRLILDDFSIGERNDELLALSSHPNIQVRIYNPFVNRTGAQKWLNFAFDFKRLNRRMHNKTFTVDSTAAIVGGRNIGDEYFNHHEHLNFMDLDLFTVGSVVEEIAQSFQHYWESPWAIPIDRLVSANEDGADNERLDKLIGDHIELLSSFPPAKTEEQPDSYFARLREELIWAPATFVYDPPGGDESEAYEEGPKPVAAKLMQLAGDSEKEVLVESAYFVLDDKALKLAAGLRDKGVKMRAVTNSMAANDVLPNHASYAMVREDMLRQGMALYELRPDANICLETIGKEKFCDEDSFFGLHAKSAVFDRRTVYVGSCNLNLRSAYLNTEVGMFVESTELAEILASQIEMHMEPANSWRPILKNDNVVWVTEVDGQEEIVPHEPHTSWFDRVKEGVLTLVPGAEYY